MGEQQNRHPATGLAIIRVMEDALVFMKHVPPILTEKHIFKVALLASGQAAKMAAHPAFRDLVTRLAESVAKPPS